MRFTRAAWQPRAAVHERPLAVGLHPDRDRLHARRRRPSAGRPDARPGGRSTGSAGSGCGARCPKRSAAISARQCWQRKRSALVSGAGLFRPGSSGSKRWLRDMNHPRCTRREHESCARREHEKAGSRAPGTKPGATASRSSQRMRWRDGQWARRRVASIEWTSERRAPYSERVCAARTRSALPFGRVGLETRQRERLAHPVEPDPHPVADRGPDRGRSPSCSRACGRRRPGCRRARSRRRRRGRPPRGADAAGDARRCSCRCVPVPGSSPTRHRGAWHTKQIGCGGSTEGAAARAARRDEPALERRVPERPRARRRRGGSL